MSQAVIALIHGSMDDNGLGDMKNDRRVQQVIADIEAGAERVAEGIVRTAVTQGQTEAWANQVNIDFGLLDPEPEPVAETPAPASDDLAGIVKAAVTEAVAPLVQFARGYGYRG